MKKEILSWDEPRTDVLTMGVSSNFDRELEQLYQEAQEYDHLMHKTSKAQSYYWEEED